jgi:hypothetical protein
MKVCTIETLPVNRMTTTDAFERLTTCANLVAMLEAPKASPLSLTYEGETTLEKFPSKQKIMARGQGDRPNPPALAFIVSKSGS